MKVAINRCYGGFRLSIEAQRKLWEARCPHMEAIPRARYFGDTPVDEQEQHLRFCNMLTDGDMVVMDRHKDPDGDNRTCHDLIKILESDYTNTTMSDINIVDIPDDVEFTIEEYDGVEWVAEKHRTWP